MIVIGEKIHCSRTVRIDGSRVRLLNHGCLEIHYTRNGRQRVLPVSADLITPQERTSGRIRPCAVAIAQALRGHGEEAEVGADYLCALAEQQEHDGAAFLDINVDQLSTDSAELIVVMRWLVGLVQDASSRPVSIDSSNPAVLRAGLEVCDRSRGRPLVNCVSLERPETLKLPADYDANAVVSAAGEDGLPADDAQRVVNLVQAVNRLRALGRSDDTLFLDPLVMPIATDGRYGPYVLETIKAMRQRLGRAIHITVGVSNVSFGLPARPLINQVFTWLAREAGADSAIADPAHVRSDRLNALDPTSVSFRLARALLLNEDEFGVAFLSAVQNGQL